VETAPLPAVLILNWRDLRNPEGGGSELYADQVASALARRGHPVTIMCAAHAHGEAEERTDEGVRIVRKGGRHTVYLAAAWEYLRGRLGHPAVVIDVQNGMPFLARLYARVPVVLLVHHVHREQWRVVLGPLAARFGWWVESWLSPRVHRRTRYVAVSESTMTELSDLGVDSGRITIIHNGTPPPDPRPHARAANPTLLVLGRLVPHKRVEVALRAVQTLAADHPDLKLVVAGQGWWLDPLREEADRLGVSDRVRFAGFVTEDEKQQLLAESWVMLVPSLKEGWGLSVIEAAAHGTPAIAFRNAGGVAESVVDGETGFLADNEESFVDHLAHLLSDRDLRTAMGEAARVHASRFTWDETGKRFAALIDEVAGEPMKKTDAAAGQRQN
jgi:glycosyltransferase involved in cell wall biosynthesis